MSEYSMERAMRGIPQTKELEDYANKLSAVEHQEAILITFFIENYPSLSPEEHKMYNYFDFADEGLKRAIAMDLTTLYCEKNNIQWKDFSILDIINRRIYYSIKALIILKN